MLERFSHAVVLLWGWRRAAVVAGAGALAALAQAPFHAFPVLWISFPVLVWALDGAVELKGHGLARLGPAFRVGWAFGFGWFLGGLWWIGGAFLVDAAQFGWLLPIALAMLSIGLGLFHGVATALARLLWSEGPARILALAFGFFVADWLRGHVLTGFPWILVGHGFEANGAMMQIAAVLGGYGPTLVAVIVFAAPALLARGSRADRWNVGAIAALFVAVVGLGGLRLALTPTETVPDLHFRIVQPATEQWKKWRPELKTETMAQFVELSTQPVRGLDGQPLPEGLRTSPPGAPRSGLPGITHLVWPESAFPFLLTQEPWALATIAQLIGDRTTLFTGAVRTEAPAAGEERPRWYNSIYALGPGAEVLAAYDKVHLVPFGEYLPFQETLESIGLRQLTLLRGGFDVGPGRRTLTLPGTPPFGPLVCYEIVFPGEVVAEAPAPRPQWLLNVTNDAWFGPTPGPWQHLHQARLRAVEEGLPVVRAANNGVSAMIDPLGRVIARSELGPAGVVDADLPAALAPTPAARHGDMTSWILASIVFSLSCWFRVKNAG